jgi:cytosine/adenosine deaminase-related metal-dependent hydrolase
VKTLLSAAYIATMAGPLIQDGAVVFDNDWIVAVGDAKSVRNEHPQAVVIDLGNAIILPGLINAHTHLELTSVPQLPKQGSFVDWILALRQQLMKVHDFESFVRDSVTAGIEQCLRFGVTAVGDITLNPSISRPILAASQLGGVSYGEVLGMAGRIAQCDTRLDSAIDRHHETDRVRFGIEPHAPYSLDLIGYRQCLQAARKEQMPLATHLAETADETQFLADHTGPFRRLWEVLGAWTDGVSRLEGGPIRAMQSLGLLDYPTLLAHVNYADDDELEILSRGKASVVYCPRTHAYFGHPPHRFEEMLERGINVAIGTDSCASSPDLNLLDDLRLVYRLRPHLRPELLWSLVTTRAATALAMKRMGRLASGFAADVCIFDVATSDPLREILETAIWPREVWMSGTRRG